MAIRIQAGMLPQFGRITMPKGTYLSNPSTAADGALGAGGGSDLPKVPQINLNPQPGQIFNGTGAVQTTPVGGGTPGGYGSSAWDKIRSIFMNEAPEMAEQPVDVNKIRDQYGDVIGDISEAWNNLRFGNQKETQAFKTPSNPTNSLVGNTISAAPNYMTQHQIQAIFGNLSPEEISKTMAAKGYTASYVSGVGQVWLKTGEPAPVKDLANAQYTQGQRVEGNPYAIGATLAPGQRVLTAGHKTEAGSVMGRGIGVTGGTSYTDKEGNTVAQYAVSYGGKGDRWKYNIQKDQAGNWVRVYYRTYSRALSRSALNRKANRKPTTPVQEQSTAPSGYDQQLVSLRADYG